MGGACNCRNYKDEYEISFYSDENFNNNNNQKNQYKDYINIIRI